MIPVIIPILSGCITTSTYRKKMVGVQGGERSAKDFASSEYLGAKGNKETSRQNWSRKFLVGKMLDMLFFCVCFAW